MSNFNEEVCEYNSTPVTENFTANRNVSVEVYHRSTDCPGPQQVKAYPNGGWSKGGYCVNMSDNYLKIIDSRDYNWTMDEIITEAGGQLYEKKNNS